MMSKPKIVIMCCLCEQQMVECVVRVIQFIAEQFIISIFSELLECWIISSV